MRHQMRFAGKGDDGARARSPLLERIRTRWRSLNLFRGGIGLRLLARVFLFSSALTLLLTLLQLYLDYRRDVGTINRRISEIEASYRRSLSEGLWDLDSRQLELQLDGILHLPDIRIVEVRETTDRGDAMAVAAGSHRANADMRYEFSISHPYRGTEQQLGVLSIEASFDEVYRRLLDTAIVILANNGVKTFLVSIFILFIVHRLITRHLTATAKSLSGYDLHGSLPSLKLERRPPRHPDELDQLVWAFNDMWARLEAADAELRASAQQLAHANRVATMGQLTASISHEVKQPISSVVLSAETVLGLLNRQPPNLEEVRRRVAVIVREGLRAGGIIDHIRALVKKGDSQSEPVDINALIRETVALTRGETAKHGISIQLQLADGLPFIEGDRIQLQQVILNLVINAIEAMSGTGEGLRKLQISTEKAEADHVLVMVGDSGPGLTPANLERLFEPFYTTKLGGLGMGLSICRSIIEAHGGRLWASANVPQGAVFQFTVPYADDTL